jgi:hypothetical protein
MIMYKGKVYGNITVFGRAYDAKAQRYIFMQFAILVHDSKVLHRIFGVLHIQLYVVFLKGRFPGLKMIKLRLETSLKSNASDWLKWRRSANQMREI